MALDVDHVGSWRCDCGICWVSKKGRSDHRLVLVAVAFSALGDVVRRVRYRARDHQDIGRLTTTQKQPRISWGAVLAYLIAQATVGRRLNVDADQS